MRISGRLCNVLPSVYIINGELRAGNRDDPARAGVRLDDFQPGRKLLIQQHTPDLRRIRQILRDRYDKIIYRSIILWCSRFAHDVGAVGQWRGHGMPSCIREYLSFPVCANRDGFGAGIVIAAIRVDRQAGNQPCGKTSAFDQIGVGLAIVGGFDDLERLLHHRFLCGDGNLNSAVYGVAGLTVNRIARAIQRISRGRRDLLHKIAAQRQTLHEGFTVLIGRHGCDQRAFFIQHLTAAIRTYDAFPRIEAVDSARKLRIALGRFRFRVLLDEPYSSRHRLIDKRVRERSQRFRLRDRAE